MISLQRNWVLSILLGITAIWIINRMIPARVDHNILLDITKNKVGIFNINQNREVESTKKVWIDKLDLHQKHRFMHPKLNNVAGFTDNFFVDITHTIKVRKAGTYEFYVGSDDGFSFSINGQKLCEFQRDRPFSIQTCPINLTEGSHLVTINYFQGGGNSGLSVQYALKGEKKEWFGLSNRWVNFK